MKPLLIIIFLFTSSLQVFSQDAYSVIADSEEHSTFLELLELMGLDSLLVGEQFHSIFVPSNETFESVFSLEQLDSLNTHDPAYLKALLLNHFVTDTIYHDQFSDSHLPLSGSYLGIFIDAAANVIVIGSHVDNATYPRLEYPANSDDAFVDATNGRVLWLENNLILPRCASLSELETIVSGILLSAIYTSELVDTLKQYPGPLTFLSADAQDTYEYIESNGGFEMTPFLDSFVRRHVVTDYIPLQKIGDGIVAQNLLGETISFTWDNDRFLVEEREIFSFLDFKHAVSLRLVSHLIAPNISTVNETRSPQIEIYPNPVSDMLNLTNPEGEQITEIKIFSIEGELEIEQKCSSAEVSVDLSRLSSGVYVMQYRMDGVVDRVRFLKF